MRTEPVPALELIKGRIDQEFPELPAYRRVPLAAYLLTRLTLLKTNEIGDLLGRGSTAVSMACQRLERRVALDEQWALRLKRAELHLRNLFAGREEPGGDPPLWYRVSLGVAPED